VAENPTLCRKVSIHAFVGDRDEALADRCSGLVPPSPSLEECLLYAGHAGVSFDDEPAIYGFLPSAPHLPTFEILKALKNMTVFPGVVNDHKQFFDFASANGRMVVELKYLYPAHIVTQVQATIHRQQALCALTYAFPGVVGSCNCATWLREIGLNIPEPTGAMRKFVPAMSVLRSNAPIAVGECVV
jgi:hypothetical protein